MNDPANAITLSFKNRDGSSGAKNAQLSAGDGVMTPELASRFLGQAAFGGTDRMIAEVLNLGYEGWIDNELVREQSWQRVRWLKARGYNADSFKLSATGFDQCVWRKLMRAPDVMRQRFSLALSEIFVVNPVNLENSGNFRQFAGAFYLDMLDRHAFGNYRELLGAVTLSPQMGAYLSMRGSRRADDTGREPDENYAREVLQLFSIGLYELNQDGSKKLDANGNPIESYTQADIAGLAQTFTGWDIARLTSDEYAHWRRPMELIPEFHESGEKSFLGTTIPAGTDGVTALGLALDRIANHPNVGPFISGQLIQRLVTSNPSPAYIGRISAVFADDGSGQRGNLGAVLKAILLDPDARDASVADSETFGKVREPMIRFIQWARAFRAVDETDEYNFYSLLDPATQLGQQPSQPPSVFNFFRPGYVPPNTDLGQLGLVAPELQITSESSVVGYANFMLYAIQTGVQGRVTPNYGREIRRARDPQRLVARLDMLLTGGQLSPETKVTIEEAVASIADDSDERLLDRVYTAIILVMVSPDYLVQR